MRIVPKGISTKASRTAGAVFGRGGRNWVRRLAFFAETFRCLLDSGMAYNHSKSTGVDPNGLLNCSMEPVIPIGGDHPFILPVEFFIPVIPARDLHDTRPAPRIYGREIRVLFIHQFGIETKNYLAGENKPHRLWTWPPAGPSPGACLDGSWHKAFTLVNKGCKWNPALACLPVPVGQVYESTILPEFHRIDACDPPGDSGCRVPGASAEAPSGTLRNRPDDPSFPE